MRVNNTDNQISPNTSQDWTTYINILARQLQELMQNERAEREEKDKKKIKKTGAKKLRMRLANAPRKVKSWVRRGLPRPFDRPRARRCLFPETVSTAGLSPLPEIPVCPQRKSSRATKSRLSLNGSHVPRRLVFDDDAADGIVRMTLDDSKTPGSPLPPLPNAPKKRKCTPTPSTQEEMMDEETACDDVSPDFEDSLMEESIETSDSRPVARVSTPASAPLPSSIWQSPAASRKTSRRKSDGSHGGIRKRLNF